jgi:hypothetical protein
LAISLTTPMLCSAVADGVTQNNVCLFREPDAGNPPVRFDEREQETEPCQTGLRRRGESRVEHPPGGYDSESMGFSRFCPLKWVLAEVNDSAPCGHRAEAIERLNIAVQIKPDYKNAPSLPGAIRAGTSSW